MQKFLRGEKVHVAKELGRMMSHFTNDIDAIVVASYSDQYRHGRLGESENEESYTLLLLLEKPTQCSWYDESQLTKVENFSRDDGEKLLQLAKHR
jgi:hypothetical protein